MRTTAERRRDDQAEQAGERQANTGDTPPSHAW
jgi:hypothetical protein